VTFAEITENKYVKERYLLLKVTKLPKLHDNLDTAWDRT